MKKLRCRNGPNPDISGIGVISSAHVQVSIVGLVAWTLYFATGDFHIVLGALKRTRTHIQTKPAGSALRHYLSVPSVFIFSLDATQQAYCAPLPAAFIDTRHVRLVQLLQDFALTLSDLLTFAGISYFVAAFSQLSSIELMDMDHMAVVQHISWFPTLAHAQALRYSLVPGMEGITVRIVAILVFYAQFLAFEGVYLAQLVPATRAGEWCNLQGDDSIPWVIAEIVFVVLNYMVFLHVFKDHMRYWRETRRSKKDDDMEAGTDLPMFVERPPTPPLRAELSLLQRGMAVVKFVWRVLTATIFNLIRMTVWIIWVPVEFSHTRDYLNDSEQDQWGFGQVLAMAALASIAFEAYKLYQRECAISFLSTGLR